MTLQSCSIVGAGGFGHELAAYLLETKAISSNQIVFWDDAQEPSIEFDEATFGGAIEAMDARHSGEVYIAVGNCSSRQSIYAKLKGRGFVFGRFIHHTAYVSDFGCIGEGCIVGPHSSVSYGAILDANILVNTCASLGHHSKIGNHTILSPNALVAGNAVIGEKVLIGSGGIVNAGVTVGDNCRIAAGSVIYRNVPGDRYVTGNPGSFAI